MILPAFARQPTEDEAPAPGITRTSALPTIEGGRSAADDDDGYNDDFERSFHPDTYRCDADPTDHRWQLKIAIALQKTLDPTALLKEFSKTLSERISHSGLRVQARPSATPPIVDQTIGSSAAHSCGFPIDLHRSDDGHRSIAHGIIEGGNDRNGAVILFFRDTPFAPREKREMARALPLLECPLRNALIHQEAIRGMFEDPLTGSYNRAMMDEVLTHEIENAARQGTPLSLMMIDIDDFKSVNDRFGHLAGDGILIDFAQRIQGSIRKKDRLFRYGGDEFMLLAGHTDDEGIRRIKRRLRTAIEDSPFDILGFDIPALDGSRYPISIRARFGIAVYRSGDGALDMIARADRDLYREKRKGEKPRI